MDVLHDRYRLVERLGAGGMSVVWRGHDQVLGRQVAVKMLNPAHAEFRHRIRLEAQSAARLNHPNIANVYDYGEVSSPEGPVPYVVMELVSGASLAARLAGDAALPWREAVRVAAEVAAALAAAHARGVVHRDVTPSNVMLTHTGAKVVDFGISALVGERDGAADGTLLGTPAYLAPERLADGEVEAATDVYALGLLLYRCLTGRLPWQASTTTGMLKAHLYTEPEPMPPVDGLPPEVVEVCHRCLAKEPADRPSSVELARALAAAVGLPAVLPAAVPGENAVVDDAETTILPWSTDTIPAVPAEARTHRLNRPALKQVAAVGAAIAGLATAGWLSGAFAPDTSTAHPPRTVAADMGGAANAVGGGGGSAVEAGPRRQPCQVRYAVTGRAGGYLNVRVTNAGTSPVSLSGRTVPGGGATSVRTPDGAALPLATGPDGAACTALLDGSGTPGGTTVTAAVPPPARSAGGKGAGGAEHPPKAPSGGKERGKDKHRGKD